MEKQNEKNAIVALICIEEWTRATENVEKYINKYPDDYFGWWSKVILLTGNFEINTNAYLRNSTEIKKTMNHAVEFATEPELSEIRNKYEGYIKTQKEAVDKQENQRRTGEYNALICQRYSLKTVTKVLGITSMPGSYNFDYITGSSSKASSLSRAGKSYSIEFVSIYGHEVSYREVCRYDDNERTTTGFKTTYYTNVDGDISSLLKNEKEKGNCFVATYVYGTYDCPEIWILRRFRDLFLKKYMLGRLFISFYYFISPQLLLFCGNNRLFAYISKKLVGLLVKKIKDIGIDNTYYSGD